MIRRVGLLVLIVVLIPVIPATAEMTVHFIDGGQGGGVFIQKDGRNIMYDCGDTFAADVVLDYLDSLDIMTIDGTVISAPAAPG